jgi:hypothetical protein
MTHLPPEHPETLLREVSGEMGLVGWSFGIIGLIYLLVVFQRGITFTAELVAVANTAVFVGPGVWYAIASRQVARAHLWVLPVTLKVAAAQGAVIVILLIMAALTPRFYRTAQFVIPGIMAIYFIPALAVLCARIVRLRRASALLEADGHAFEPIRVQPIESPQDLVELELDEPTPAPNADRLKDDGQT